MSNTHCNHRPGLKKLLTTIIVLLFLAGCATLSRDECINADWRSIGYEDGARGYPASRIGSHREACAKHGVKPNFSVYENGRIDGLREFCRPGNGYRLGAKGVEYSGVCPADLEEPFLAAYRHGQKVHGLENQLKSTKKTLGDLHGELESLENRVAHCESELVQNGIGRQRRVNLLEELKTLSEQRRYLQEEIGEQEFILAETRRRLSRTKAQRPY